VPPRDVAEAGFDGLHDLPAIERRLTEISRTKCDDVVEQLVARPSSKSTDPDQVVIAADTVIVANDASGRPRVLGQPPEDDAWPDVVRHWFREFYAGKSHLALTALCVHFQNGLRVESITRSEVTFISDVDSRLDWYIATGEPRGKAGGYALQGAGSIFIANVTGSLSNVIGLPLESLLDALHQMPSS